MTIATFVRKIKLPLKQLFAWGYFHSGLYKKANMGTVSTLMYHRVLENNDPDISFIQPGMYVTTSVFEKHITYLKANYELISFLDFLNVDFGRDLDRKKRYCIITFDDGWHDNYTNAFPILKKHNIPATVFLTTSLIGTTHWFWPDKLCYLLANMPKNRTMAKDYDGANREITSALALILSKVDRHDTASFDSHVDTSIGELKKMPEKEVGEALDNLYAHLGVAIPQKKVLLDWEEVRIMSASGISFGSHTCCHKILTNYSHDKIMEELKESKRVIESNAINHIPVLAYPNGNYNYSIEKLAQKAGYIAAVTTEFGHVRFGTKDVFKLKRIGVHNKISESPSMYTFLLSGIGQTSHL